MLCGTKNMTGNDTAVIGNTGLLGTFCKMTPTPPSCRACSLGWGGMDAWALHEKDRKCLRATWTPHSLSDETPHEVGTVFTPVRTSKRVDLQYKQRGGKRNGVIGRQMVWQMEQLNWINNRRLSRSKSLAHSAHIFPKSRWNKPWEQKFALISKFIFQ